MLLLYFTIIKIIKIFSRTTKNIFRNERKGSIKPLYVCKRLCNWIYFGMNLLSVAEHLLEVLMIKGGI